MLISLHVAHIIAIKLISFTDYKLMYPLEIIYFTQMPELTLPGVTSSVNQLESNEQI